MRDYRAALDNFKTLRGEPREVEKCAGMAATVRAVHSVRLKYGAMNAERLT